MSPNNNSKPSNKHWGGRFTGGPAEIMEKINASIAFDRRLFLQDIAGSRAHADMLVAQNILSSEDGKAINEGLELISQEILAGNFSFS
jgi:argininosuccinate lyase